MEAELEGSQCGNEDEVDEIAGSLRADRVCHIGRWPIGSLALAVEILSEAVLERTVGSDMVRSHFNGRSGNRPK